MRTWKMNPNCLDRLRYWLWRQSDALKDMKIKRSPVDNGYYAVFSGWGAEDLEWLFHGILRRRIACFGGYENAWHLFG
jgi:hypothetical protein